jgi:hypothetical protein
MCAANPPPRNRHPTPFLPRDRGYTRPTLSLAFHASQLRGDMPCERCRSAVQKEFDGEVTASFPDINRSRFPPVYISQRISVCLDCGFAAFVMPAPELEQLRKGLAVPGSQGTK